MKTQDMGYLALKAQTEAKVGGGGTAGRAWRLGRRRLHAVLLAARWGLMLLCC